VCIEEICDQHATRILFETRTEFSVITGGGATWVTGSYELLPPSRPHHHRPNAIMPGTIRIFGVSERKRILGID